MKTHIERYALPATIIFMIFAPWLLSAYALTTLMRFMYYGLMAMSLGFLMRNGGMISLAQAAFFGLACYMVAIFSVSYGWAFPWPPLMGLLICLGGGLLFGCIALRTFDISFLMITLAIGQLCWALALQWISFFGGFNGIQGIRPPNFGIIDFNEPRALYGALLICFWLCLLLLRRVDSSPFGLALRGVKDNPLRLSALGYSVFNLRLKAFVLAAMLAGVGGIFSAYHSGVATPSVLSLDRTIWVLLVVILGGAGVFWGPLLGTAFVLVLEVSISMLTPRYNTVIGVIFLLVVLFARDRGLLSLVDTLRSRLFRTRA